MRNNSDKTFPDHSRSESALLGISRAEVLSRACAKPQGLRGERGGNSRALATARVPLPAGPPAQRRRLWCHRVGSSACTDGFWGHTGAGPSLNAKGMPKAFATPPAPCLSIWKMFRVPGVAGQMSPLRTELSDLNRRWESSRSAALRVALAGTLVTCGLPSTLVFPIVLAGSAPGPDIAPS